MHQLLTPAGSDTEWVEEALRSIALVEPLEPGVARIAAREAWARDHVARVPATRIPALLVTLFSIYEVRKRDSFMELMWLIEALYAGLPVDISPDDACSILAATRHSCGHGGVVEPVELACASFGREPYTPTFFGALRTYRNRLKGLYSAKVTRIRGQIAFLLWQDPTEPLRPRNCLSRGVREGFFALPDERRGLWTRLLRHTDRSARRRPARGWIRNATAELGDLAPAVFAADVSGWLKVPEGPVPLSTGGRHILKTIIWFAGIAKTNDLDDVLPALIDAQYSDPKSAVHLIYAVGYWLESRSPEVAEPLRKRLREKWPAAGSRVRG